MLYVITKSFRDVTGMRLPGEAIELTPARAATLRDSGLVGGEYVPPAPETPIPSGFEVTFTDESGKSVTEYVEAASYQGAVDKVISRLFAEPDLESSKVTTKTPTKKKAGK